MRELLRRVSKPATVHAVAGLGHQRRPSKPPYSASLTLSSLSRVCVFSMAALGSRSLVLYNRSSQASRLVSSLSFLHHL
jgi:hypothetical protein